MSENTCVYYKGIDYPICKANVDRRKWAMDSSINQCHGGVIKGMIDNCTYYRVDEPKGCQNEGQSNE